MLYPLSPQLDFLTANNLLLAAAVIGGIVALGMIYARVTRPAHISGTLSRR